MSAIAPSQAPSAPPSSARVLVVDDVPSMSRSLASLIEARMPGVAVESSSSPAQAIARLGEVDFDVILTDLLMPGIDGIALLEQARRERPGAVVVIISGVEDAELTRRALRGGAYDFLLKPVDPEHLEASVRRGLETRRLRREVEEHQAALRRHAEKLERSVEARTVELQRASRSKDEFLATLSHELRTPLTAILGWARLLKGDKLDAATRTQALESIARNAAIQSHLIDDLLDVSSIITGRLQIDARHVDVESLVAVAVDAVLPSARAKGVTIEMKVDPDVGALLGDGDRLVQVCWNLLSNAVKFSASRVRLTAARSEGRVVIEVSDDGVGIEPSFLPFVFDRFRQGDPARQFGRRGLGLGLAIARHIVELHAGAISATSEGPGRGATFRIDLAAQDPGAGGVRARLTSPSLPSLDEAPSTELRGILALVVDDEPDGLEVVRAILEQAGAVVEVAGTGYEALERFAAIHPDVLICDIGLPDIDGCSVLKEIRSLPADKGASVPAIAFTAHARMQDRARALSAGFDLHLAKPGPSDLAMLVGNLLSTQPAFQRRAS